MSHIYGKIYEELESRDELPMLNKLKEPKSEFNNDYNFNDEILITFLKREVLKLKDLGIINDIMSIIGILDSDTDTKVKSEYIVTNILLHL